VVNDRVKESMEEKTEKVKIPAIISVGDLANRLSLPVSKIISELMKNGVMATINESIDYETAEIVAEFLGITVEPDTEVEDAPKEEIKVDKKKQIERPPVVAVLGHVDHGKTSLLDKIRETNVVAKESGGITQHIGAYQVTLNDKDITFLDTPGHEAFEAMRAHGAKITDIAILIVAADDGIKPQTTEAIRHIKDANTPMLVALNKIDKPDADPTRVKKQFTEIGLTPHEWGGDVEFVEVSAKSGVGIDKLLETVVAMADIMDLKADPTAAAQGVVIESKIEVGKGPVASILIQNGTLHAGDWVQVGETYGRVKAMEDDKGRRLKEALPSHPVKVSGLKDVPKVAELLQKYENEMEARDEAKKTQKYSGVKKVANVKKIGLEAISASLAKENKTELSLVVKADVVGSLDAVKESLEKLGNADVGVKFVGEGVGDISESDVSMASVSDKVIIGFKAGVGPGVSQAAKAKAVKIFNYDVIYELIDDVKKILSDMMPVEKIEIPIGVLKVLAIFKVSPGKTVAGGKVEDGRAEKDVQARIKRDGEVISTQHVIEVQRAKEIVQSVPSGSECGVSFGTRVDVKEGDVIEFFRVEEHKKSL
jgi:translation initiation factor IF-2